MSPLSVIATLVVGAVGNTKRLQARRGVSQMATGVGPGTTSIRLPETNLPMDHPPGYRCLSARWTPRAKASTFSVISPRILPIAATPLSIVTAALDVVAGNGEITKIKPMYGDEPSF